MSTRRNPDEYGIGWDRDDYIIRDITPAPIAVFDNVDGQVIIRQGSHDVVVGSRDLGELLRQVSRLAFMLGYKPPSAPKPPAQVFSLPGRKPDGSD